MTYIRYPNTKRISKLIGYLAKIEQSARSATKTRPINTATLNHLYSIMQMSHNGWNMLREVTVLRHRKVKNDTHRIKRGLMPLTWKEWKDIGGAHGL